MSLRLAVLLNASAGTIERHGCDRLIEQLTAAFDRHGVVATVVAVPCLELAEAARQARQAVLAGELDGVVVGGGDGTIRTVAAVLVESEVPLGIIPLGTLNHFARDAGLPLVPEQAVAVIAGAHTRRVDVGEVNGEIFINNSSMGVYPYLVLDRDRRRRLHGTSKWLALVPAVWRTLRNFPLRRLSISAAGWRRPSRTPLVFVGNNEYQVSAPKLGQRVRLDGGELCVYVAPRQSRLALFWLACRAVLGLLDRARELQMFKLPEVTIRSRRRRLLVACDGEVEILRQPLHYRTRPRALRIFAPPQA
ncbi:MAG TPA: diacylglycerol kinase family protein [Xanthobacteraceae bacterium]